MAGFLPYLYKLVLEVKTNKGQRVTVSVFTGALTGAIYD